MPDDEERGQSSIGRSGKRRRGRTAYEPYDVLSTLIMRNVQEIDKLLAEIIILSTHLL